MKREGPKASTAIRGPLGLIYQPLQNANTTAECLENQFTPHDFVMKTMKAGDG